MNFKIEIKQTKHDMLADAAVFITVQHKKA
jgi:hypothetical protein